MSLAIKTKIETKALYLESYGCQMNEYDSGIVKNLLQKEGYGKATKPENAQLILLNTCAIREKAHERIYGRLTSFSVLKRKNPKLLIGILGCMAQNLGDDLFAMGLPIDFVVGPDNYRQLPDLIRKIEQSQELESSWNLSHLSRTETYEEIQPEVINGKLAFVTIMRGCDNFCSFCVVPYTRGRERSRRPSAIVEEIQNLIDKHDIKEITLLGQNVNSYSYEKISFCSLVQKIIEETNIQRIRFTSPHPHDFPEDLLELMVSEERFCSQIHLPLQSGSTSVLERMRRDYSQKEFLTLVEKIRKTIPEVGLSTDIIVGFCGETESEFNETLKIMKEVQFDMAYMFRYSERNHTYAQKRYKDDVEESTKLSRLQKLINVQQEISRKINEKYIGKTLNVLVEGYSRRSREELMGRSCAGKVVVFPLKTLEQKKNTPSLIGKSIPIQIETSTSATLRGSWKE